MYPTMEAMQVKPYHVEKWVARYELAVTTQRNYFRPVKRCYKWGKSQGYLSDNPIESLEVPCAEHHEISLSHDDFETLMTFVVNDNLADLVRITWETGCRPQESLIVEARHVDITNQRWVFDKSQSKGKKVSRVVYLTDTVMEIVQRLMAVHPTGPLFRNSNGNPWKTDAVNCAFDAIQVRMGKAEMARKGIEVSDADIKKFIPTLKPMKIENGSECEKRPAELRCEAKRKLTVKLACHATHRFGYSPNLLLDAEAPISIDGV